MRWKPAKIKVEADHNITVRLDVVGDGVTVCLAVVNNAARVWVSYTGNLAPRVTEELNVLKPLMDSEAPRVWVRTAAVIEVSKLSLD